MTIGSHWPLSCALNNDERTRVQRVGVCMGCHQNMASPEFWHDDVVAKYGQVASTDEHIDAMNQVILDAIAADDSVEVPVAPSTEQITAAKQAAAEAQAATAESEAAVARATAVAAIKEAQEPRPASPMAFVAILVAVVALLFADAVAIAAGMIRLVPDKKSE